MQLWVAQEVREGLGDTRCLSVLPYIFYESDEGWLVALAATLSLLIY